MVDRSSSSASEDLGDARYVRPLPQMHRPGSRLRRELRDDLRCTKCGSVPSTYEVDGGHYCWPHRERMTDTYPVSAFFLTTVYAWRGHSHRFPNAKLFQAGTESGVFGEETILRFVRAVP